MTCVKCLLTKAVGEFTFDRTAGRYTRRCKRCRAEVCAIGRKNMSPTRRSEVRAYQVQYACKWRADSANQSAIQRYRATAKSLPDWRERGLKSEAKYRASDHGKEVLRRKYVVRQNALAAGTVTWEEWLSVIADYGGRCAYCRREVELTMDHIVPIARGGMHEVSNIAPACKPCNSGKKDRDVWYWMGRLARRTG